jgi:hypothetical protein
MTTFLSGSFLKKKCRRLWFHSHTDGCVGLVLQTKHLLMLAIGLEGIGGLLFTLGSTLGAYMLLLFLALVTPVMHDFYNFDQSSLEYHHQFIGFLKNLSQFGALLFYLGMKNSASRNKMRKKHVTKPKSL